MPVSAALPSILPSGSLLRLKQLEDMIAYKYSQDRIDQGLDQDGNDIDGYGQSDNDDDDDDNLDQTNTQWLLKQLAKLEETAPPEDEEDEELEEQQQDTQSHKVHHLSSTKKQIVETPQEQAYRRQHEQLTERVSSCLAHFCGRAASGAMTRTWTFRTTPPQSLQIHDPSFTEGDVGFKTFGSAYLLSKHIAHGDILQLEPWTKSSSFSSTLPLPKILELGSGTGLVGFTATLFSDPRGPKVTLSDYHPNVLATLDHNSKLNHLDTRCEIRLLDWRDILDGRKQRNAGTNTSLPETAESDRMDLIIGAEVVYDHGHAELVAHVVDEFLKRELISQDMSVPLERRRPAFHIMFPIRPTHADVIADFDFWMDKMGLVDCRKAKEWGREDGETKFLYHWREYVRRDHLEG
ncbi:hypothetical protein BG006_009137 [Podila minutissima]|uniref:Uncharacterized protein n=1 Tax=Podila minutissima TaxID=64525 RepID=A0A9P5SV50_9FUNG|nr:hypothetical protein BG006_009137 [Podila minutissima]